MPDAPSIGDLMSRWEREGISPEELCAGHPELLPDLREAIAARQSMDRWLSVRGSTTDESKPDGIPDSSVQEPAESHSPGNLPHARNCADPAPTSQPGRAPHDGYRTPQESGSPPPDPQKNEPARELESTDPDANSSLMVGRYRLTYRVGRGAFGEVWKAFDTLLETTVAIKRPRPDRVFSSRQIEAFLREARKAASLKHPHIVPVHNIERDSSSWYIVSDFIEGTSLSKHQSDHPLSPAEIAQLIAAIAEALHLAHLQGLVHRDVKPGNILVDRTHRPYLTDFGLAISEDEQWSQRNSIAGTLAYMSPEQIRGESHYLDGRSDIYSLGVVLYELLTGRMPFKGNGLLEYRDQILHREPRPPRAINDSIPLELERICLKCMSKSVNDRYTTAGDLARELRTWRESSPSTSTHAVSNEQDRQQRRVPMRWVGVLVGCVVVLLASAWLFSGKWAEPQPTTQQEGQGEQRLGSTLRTRVDLDQLPLLRWHDLMLESPREISWPRGAGASQWHYNQDRGELFVLNGRLGLLELGEVQSGSYLLSIGVLQYRWTGGLGVYLGYQPPDEQGKGGRIQFLQFQREKRRSGKYGFNITRGFIHLERKKDGTLSGTLHGIKSHPLQDVAGEQTLEICVVNHCLKRVKVNGVKAPLLIEGTNSQRFSVADHQGGFGVFVAFTGGYYRNARFMRLTHAP